MMDLDIMNMFIFLVHLLYNVKDITLDLWIPFHYHYFLFPVPLIDQPDVLAINHQAANPIHISSAVSAWSLFYCLRS